MKINKNSLQARINRLVKEKNISQSVVYPRFFFDAFLKRLSVSKYRDFFLLKGGLFLSSKLGIENRSTMDIDFLATKVNLEDPDKIIQIIDEICEVCVDDNVVLKSDAFSRIKLSEKNPGLRIRITGNLENVRQTFSIDIALGDPVINPGKYMFPLIISNEKIEIDAYSLESVIAEKLETVLTRGEGNTRQKDLYDLFMLRKVEKEINVKRLNIAFAKTCSFRRAEIIKEKAFMIINLLKTSDLYAKNWKLFTKNNSYAKNISFYEVMNAVEHWLEVVY